MHIFKKEITVSRCWFPFPTQVGQRSQEEVKPRMSPLASSSSPLSQREQGHHTTFCMEWWHFCNDALNNLNYSLIDIVSPSCLSQLYLIRSDCSHSYSCLHSLVVLITEHCGPMVKLWEEEHHGTFLSLGSTFSVTVSCTQNFLH